MMPSNSTAAINSDVAIGRRMKIEEKPMGVRRGCRGEVLLLFFPLLKEGGLRGMALYCEWRSHPPGATGVAGRIDPLPLEGGNSSAPPPAAAAGLCRSLDLGRGRWRRDLAGLHGVHLAALLEAELSRGDHLIACLETVRHDDAGVACLAAGDDRLHGDVLGRLVVGGCAARGTFAATSLAACRRRRTVGGVFRTLVGDQPHVVAVRPALHGRAR